MDVYACCVTCAKEAHCELFGLGPDLADEHVLKMVEDSADVG